MPPRTRATKSSKILKENIGIERKVQPKVSAKVAQPTRKVLTDKTNSASDENGSIETPSKASKNLSSSVKPAKMLNENNLLIKLRRERRPPKRFIDSDPIKSVSKNDISIKEDSSSQSPFKTPQKPTETSMVVTRPQRVSRLPSRFEDHSMSPCKFIPVRPFQASTPISQKSVKAKEVKNTLKESQDKISRKENVTKILMSKASVKKLEQNKITPPDSNNNAKGRTLRSRQNADTQKLTFNQAELQNDPLKPVLGKQTKAQKSPAKTFTKVTPNKPKTLVKKVVSSKVSPKTSTKVTHKKPKSPVKKEVSLKIKTVKKSRPKVLSPNKAPSANNIISPAKTNPGEKSDQRPLNRDFSFKILEDNKNENNLDVYEFTFDPNEEPAPQKKKKKVVKKRAAKPKPKTVVFKNNYQTNVNKALAALKNAVAKKPIQGIEAQKQQTTTNVPEIKVNNTALENIENINTNVPHIQRNVASKIIIGSTAKSPPSTVINAQQNVLQIQQNILIISPDHQSGINMNNTMLGLINSANASKLPDQSKSTRVEDIAADFELDLNYSPVNSPARPETPVAQISRKSMPYNNDPLNLRENSFFEQNPVASSSINMSMSAQHPQPSPWRAEFEDLPLRWHVNSYVKPNMTPAVERSFINYDNKKRHVYTNLVPDSNDALPEIVQKDQPNFIQTSMFDFIRQQVEKSSAKKKRGRSVTPVTATLFNDTTDKTPNKDSAKVARSTRQLFTPKKNEKSANSVTGDVNTSEDIENSKDSSTGRKRKNEDNYEHAPPKTPREVADNKYFGFDDSENVDQENASPKKVKGRKRALRPRGRAVLKEINDQGPTRGTIPIAAKTALNAEVERLYNEMKAASDAPLFPEKDQVHIGTTTVCEPSKEMTADSQISVHLFEDIEEIVHHIKPQRKSYGKAKKVTFRQASTDSDSQDEAVRAAADHSDADDDLADFTFDPGVPFVEEKKKKKRKKLTKKQKMTKKEEEEAEAWAAGFNSMCEDVEEFPLVIE